MRNAAHRRRGRPEKPIKIGMEAYSAAKCFLSAVLPKHDELEADEFVDWLRKKRVEKATRAEELKLFALAYAAWACKSDDRAVLSALTGLRFRDLRGNPGPKPFLKALLTYPSDKEALTRNLSRDVCAIRFLASAGIGPDEVATAKGEGRNAWSRGQSKLLSHRGAEDARVLNVPSPKKAKKGTQPPDAEVTIAVPGQAAAVTWTISNRELVLVVMRYMEQLASDHSDYVSKNVTSDDEAVTRHMEEMPFFGEPDELASNSIRKAFQKLSRSGLE